MAAETQYTAKTGIVQVSTANPNLDGTTGAYSGTILTGATTGTLLKAVTVKALVTTNQGMVRLFVTGGGNTRLLLEIPIEPMTINTTEGTDYTFEKRVELDFKLKNGYTVKASTEAGNLMNVFIEALDWTYYSSSVRPESTNYTANTGMGQLTLAQTTLDAPSTNVVTVLTAPTSATGWNGTAVESITVKAVGTVTNGMVRIFINNGTTNYLFTEVFVEPIAQVGTFPTFNHKIMFPNKLQLQADYFIKATTQYGETINVIAESLDWKYPA